MLPATLTVIQLNLLRKPVSYEQGSNDIGT
jgi:hypothetical protein